MFWVFFQGDAGLDLNTCHLIPLQGKTSCLSMGGRATDISQLPQVCFSCRGHLAPGHGLLGHPACCEKTMRKHKGLGIWAQLGTSWMGTLAPELPPGRSGPMWQCPSLQPFSYPTPQISGLAFREPEGEQIPSEASHPEMPGDLCLHNA